MSEPSLSPSNRRTGWRRYMLFAIVNGFSFGLLAENVLVLYALKADVPEYIAGILPSFMFLAMPFMLLGKKMMSRFGAARTVASAWGARNTSALLMVAAPFLYVFDIRPVVIALIVVSSFGFYACRAMGVVAFRPLIGDITTETDRGRFLGSMGMRFNASYLLALIILALVMKISPAMHILQGLIGLGCMAGLFSAWIVAGVPETKAPKISAQQPILHSVVRFWQNRRTRKLLFAQMAGWGAFSLIVPFSVVALKSGFGASDFETILFILVQVFGSMMIAVFFGMIADKVGPRPLMILYGAGFLVVALLWALTPETKFFFYVGLIFFMGGACKVGVFQGLDHYFLRSTNAEDRVMHGMLIQMLGGASAGLAGGIIGGGLLKILSGMALGEIEVFKIYFIIVAVVLLPLLWCLIRLEPVRDWEVKDVLSLIASPRNWWELHQLLKLERSHSPREEKIAVDKLATIKPNFSQEALLESLKSPDFLVRSRTLAALRSIKLGGKAQEALIKEVEENVFTTAYIAAEILGEQKVDSAVPVLRRTLNSDDIYLQGKSMVALVHLNDAESFDKIAELFRKSDNPRLIIHGAMALSEMNQPGYIVFMLPRACENNLPLKVKQEILYHCADLTDCPTAFYHFQKLFRSDKDNALQYIREKLKAPYQRLLDEFQLRNFELNEFISKLVSEREKEETEVQKAVVSALNSIAASSDTDPPEEFPYAVLLIYGRK